VFEVPFCDGELCLSARGTFRGEEVHDALRLRFASVPAHTAAEGLGTAELAVNVGSDCFFTSDESGLTWVPDRPYEPGGWGYLGGRPRSTQTQIDLTADGPLFQTMREGMEGYRFDVPPGDYELELLFADPDLPAEGPAYLLGKGDGSAAAPAGNRFAIRIDGRTAEPDFFPARDSGCCRAIRRRYLVHCESGRIVVELEARQGRTFLSAVKLRKM
ncbi:MAG: malectin, partial [Alistipes sp.]|nr:malectin [Alistipes sp.]